MDYLPNEDLMYTSKEEEELMIAALEKVERLERAKKQQTAFREKWAARQQVERSAEGSTTSPPQIDYPKSNDPSSLPENVVAVNVSEVGLVVGSKRKYSETDPGISAETDPGTSAEVEEDPNPTGNGHSDLDKEVRCEWGCGKAFADRNKMKQHLRRVHVTRKHACERCRKTFKTKSHLKRHAQSGGPCDTKRQRLEEEVPDLSGEQPGPSTTTSVLYESSSELEDARTEAEDAKLLMVEDGVEIGGGEEKREDDVLKEDPLTITESWRI
ncbi:MDS1 and EVI1 complex locus protein [Holothuria leucospilota]|uniref:MDS1 and EVI1 complex locus protein n=1 Tax=Holothuria leucospilota TaxID=206669 RepID=A0A9Q1B9A7_HOLLE|nr:MDS1 and EVI1 complex locus protein [Holothuria leucospilota]